MEEKSEILLRLLRMWIAFVFIIAGVVCAFVIPGQGVNMLGSSLLIGFPYFLLLQPSKGQITQLSIFLSVVLVTAYAYACPSHNENGLLFLPQILYLFYAMGKIFIFKELRKTFEHFGWFGKKKS